MSPVKTVIGRVPETRMRLRSFAAVLAMFAVSISSHLVEADDESPREKSAGTKDAARADSPGDREEKTANARTEHASSTYLLSPDDVANFRSGRLKDEILNNVHWRGNFEMATEYEGHEVCAISFGLFGGIFGDDSRGITLWAVFVDDKFQKFVKWPEWNEKPLKVGEFRELLGAMQGEPVNISDLEKNARPSSHTSSRHVDSELTGIFLILGPAIEARVKWETDKNAKLRDQYNAARLKLGMSPGDVELILKAKPLEFGDFDAGSWQLYGSKEYSDLIDYERYSNILILFKSGKVNGIYSGSTVPGGAHGIRWLREGGLFQGTKKMRPSFSDLPPSKSQPK